MIPMQYDGMRLSTVLQAKEKKFDMVVNSQPSDRCTQSLFLQMNREIEMENGFSGLNMQKK